MKRWLFLLAFGVSLPSLSAVYPVGPERAYKTLQEVAGLLNPGDEVLVDGGATYPGDIVFTRPGTEQAPIRIRGLKVGGLRPVLSGGTNTVTFSTPWPYDAGGADHYLLEGFEVTGGSFRGIFHQADDLTLRDVVVHDCPAHGILGADEGSGSLRMEYCEVYRCGSGSSQHQVYVATDEVSHPGSVFRMQFCYLHDGNGGNNVKSRCERNEIYYNWVEGAYYHELELIGPDGGDGGNPSLKREDSDVVGNVLVKRATAASNDPNFSVTRVGGDGTGETDGRYRFVNNTVLCGTGAVFRIFDGIESIEMHNNVLAPIGSGPLRVKRTVEAQWSTGQEVIAGSNNWVTEGALDVPVQWTGTLTGGDPGFQDPPNANLRPGQGSPLMDAGTASPQPPVGFPFPSPLFPPAFHPPDRALLAPGSGQPRPEDAHLDIGAFERGNVMAPPLITSFTADPAQVSQGGMSTLHWTVTGASSLLLDPGSLDVAGAASAEVSPPSTTLYTLTASNAGGSVSSSLTVTVLVPDYLCVDGANGTGTEDGTPLHPFRTLRDAAQAALSGTEIRAAGGEYPQNVLVENRALRLLGGYAGGSAQQYGAGVAGDFDTRDTGAFVTHLMGDGTAAVLTFRRTQPTPGPTVVDGFRITGGSRGIYLDGEYPSGDFQDFTLSGNLIEDNGPLHPDPLSMGGGICAEGVDIRITGNTVRNNRAGMGAGIARSAQGWVIRDNVVEGNLGSGDHGGGLWLAGSGVVAGNTVRNNRIGEELGYGWGGGALFVGQFTSEGNLYEGNQAHSLGGGVFVDEGAEVTLRGDRVVRNRTLEEWVKGGAGIYVDASWDEIPSVAHIVGCTVAGNTSPGTLGGNGVFVQGSQADVNSCIFWGNSGGDDFFLDPSVPGILSVSYTLSQEPWPGAGNLSVDPLFADAPAGNFRLRSMSGRWDDATAAWVSDAEDSPAIDAGDPTAEYALEPDPNGGRRNLGFDGNTASASKSTPAGCTLECAAEASASSGQAPLAVVFTASAQASGCAESPAFLWDFGDGLVSAAQNPTHTYAAPGSYTWIMTASVPGQTCPRSGQVDVSGPPLPGDCDGDGTVSIGEVQKAINMFLGVLPVGCGADCNGDGQVSIGEVQKVINAFLGLASECS